MKKPQIRCHSAVQGVEKLQNTIQRSKSKSRGVLMVMIPGTDLGFGDDHQIKINTQNIGIIYHEVEAKIDRGEGEYYSDR